MRFNAYLNMQKSKKMMVSLCGLALSSLFVLNNKSVVHADTVDGTQNNAISWNSDSDAAQNVQNTQKADDDQQNAQSAQPSRAETSTVRSSLAAPRTTNQSVAVQSPRVANVQDAQKTSPVVINNPAGDKVNVHYVNRDGGAITDPNVKDTTIDVTKTGQGSYNVPNGYSLNNPDGKYTISGGAFNGTNLKGNVEHYDAVLGGHLSSSDFGDGARCFYGVGYQDGRVYVPADEGGSWLTNMSQYNITYHSTDEFGNQYYSVHGYSPSTAGVRLNIPNNASPNGFRADITNLSVYGDDYYILVPHDQTKEIEPAYDEQHLPVAFVDSNNNIVGMIQNYSGKVGTTQNVNLTLPTGYKLADGASLPTSVTFQNSTNPLLVKVVPNGKTQSITNPANNTVNVKFVDQTTGAQVGTDTIDLTKAQSGINYYNVPAGYGAANNSYQVGTTGYSWTMLEKSGTLEADDDGLLYTYKIFGVDPNKELEVEYVHGDRGDRGYIEANDEAYSLGNYQDAFPNNKPITVSEYRELTDFWNSFGFIPTVSHPVYTFTPSHELTDAYNTISGNTVTVPVHKSTTYQFADNSGNVKSVSGNTVDVTLTKPQSVNPDSNTLCHSQATRTIQINFPDGQVPKSYDGIVDKSGKLVQTVHFTRPATEDALTGNILWYGSWTSDNKDHNFIGFEARTLPRIPGYTLSIKPAQA